MIAKTITSLYLSLQISLQFLTKKEVKSLSPLLESGLDLWFIWPRECSGCDNVPIPSLGPKRPGWRSLAPMQLYWHHVNKHCLACCWIVRLMKQSSPSPDKIEITARWPRLTKTSQALVELLSQPAAECTYVSSTIIHLTGPKKA